MCAHHVHWRIVCVICGAIPIVVFVCMIFLPETPPWLVLNNKKEEAEKSLRWLRGEVYDISQELEALEAVTTIDHSATGAMSGGTARKAIS